MALVSRESGSLSRNIREGRRHTNWNLDILLLKKQIFFLVLYLKFYATGQSTVESQGCDLAKITPRQGKLLRNSRECRKVEAQLWVALTNDSLVEFSEEYLEYLKWLKFSHLLEEEEEEEDARKERTVEIRAIAIS